MVSGIIIGAFGFGAFLFGFLTSEIVNPDNMKKTEVEEDGQFQFYDIDISGHVPKMFNTCIIIWAVLLVTGSLLVSRSP